MTKAQYSTVKISMGRRAIIGSKKPIAGMAPVKLSSFS